MATEVVIGVVLIVILGVAPFVIALVLNARERAAG